MAISPTAEGFRAAFRRPSLTFAEITWRWTTGATAISVFFFGLFEYLSTLPVTNGELLFLRTRQPYLVGEAIAHIFRGSLTRGVMALLLAGDDARDAVDDRRFCWPHCYGACFAGIFSQPAFYEFGSWRER